MKPSILVALGVRLFSIFLWVYLFKTLLTQTSFLIRFEDYPLTVVVVVFLVGVAFLAVFLWKFPLYVAEKLVSFGDKEPDIVPVGEQATYNVGFVLLGMLMAYWAVSDTVYWLTYLKIMKEEMSSGDQLWSVFVLGLGANEKASMIATAFEIVMAFALVFGAKNLSGFVTKLRRAGL